MFGGNGLSLADIAAVTRGSNNSNGDGLGAGNGWWVLIILFALFGGWGNGGYGNNNGRNSGGDTNTTTVVPVPMGGYCMSNGYSGNGFGFAEASLQRGFDTQTIISKLDGLNNGVCSLGYDQLNQMNGINSNIMQTGFSITNAIQNASVNNMQSFNALSTQLANCCCENRQGQAQIQFDLSQLGCTLQNAINNQTREVIQNDNTNYRMLNDTIRDGFTTLQMQQKDQQIANLQEALQNCYLNSALQGTAEQIINRVSPVSRPAYLTCNPNTGNWLPCGVSLNGGCSGCCN